MARAGGAPPSSLHGFLFQLPLDFLANADTVAGAAAAAPAAASSST
jgi:hypothetical protein